MRVLWIHNNPSRSSGTFMWDIFDRLRRSGDGSDLQESALPLLQARGALWRAITIARARSGADLVHAQYGALVGLLSLLQKCTANVISLRGSDVYWRFGSARNRIAGLLRMLMSWMGCLGSDAVIVMSKRMVRRIQRWPGLSRKPVIFIPDPAGEIFWPPAATDISKELLSQPFLVAIASIQHDNPIKRTWLVSEAAEACRSVGMSLELKMLSGISREEVRSALSGVDSIALASTHEGWPNIVKEGLLLGANFVATPVGDLPDFAPEGSGNHIVDPHPIGFVCAWIDQIAARILSPHGIATGLEAFHPDVVALKHRVLYRLLLEQEG